MCHAGSGISSYKWLPERIIPWPILNSVETCVDWDHYASWVHEHSIPVEQIATLEGLLVHPTLGPLSIHDYKSKEKELHEAAQKAKHNSQ